MLHQQLRDDWHARERAGRHARFFGIVEFLDRVGVSGGRPVVWIFAEEDAALFARKLFKETKGLGGITVGYISWNRRAR